MLADLRDRYRKQFTTPRRSALVFTVIDHLFETPALTVPGIARKLEISHRGADLIVKKLVRANILREGTPGTRPRLFVASEILAALNASNPPTT
jgi:hypothetical protein